MCVCVGGCVSAAGCDGMITLRPDGWFMRYAWEDSCSLLFSAHSHPHLKLKIHQDSGIKLLNTRTTGWRFGTGIQQNLTRFVHSATVIHMHALQSYCHCDQRGKWKFFKSLIFKRSWDVQKLYTKIRDCFTSKVHICTFRWFKLNHPALFCSHIISATVFVSRQEDPPD